MKILWNNYLEDSTVTASDNDSLYPVSNLTDTFLLRKFQPGTSSTTVTVLFPEDRTVSMIAYGYNNVESATEELIITKGALEELIITKGATEEYIITLEAQYRLKDSGGSTLYTGVLDVGSDTNVSYPTSTVCRSVEIDFAAGTTLYVGGLSIGDPFAYEGIQISPNINLIPRVRREVTEGGQLVAQKNKALKTWRVTLPTFNNAKRLEISTMIESVGYDKCFYVDLLEDSDNIDPMYCSFTDIGRIRAGQDMDEYTMGITFEEKR